MHICPRSVCVCTCTQYFNQDRELDNIEKRFYMFYFNIEHELEELVPVAKGPYEEGVSIILGSHQQCSK